MPIYALSIKEILDGQKNFICWGVMVLSKNSYMKMEYPSITFDGNVMERWCKRVKDWARGALSFELYPLSCVNDCRDMAKIPKLKIVCMGTKLTL